MTKYLSLAILFSGLLFAGDQKKGLTTEYHSAVLGILANKAMVQFKGWQAKNVLGKDRKHEIGDEKDVKQLLGLPEIGTGLHFPINDQTDVLVWDTIQKFATKSGKNKSVRIVSMQGMPDAQGILTVSAQSGDK